MSEIIHTDCKKCPQCLQKGTINHRNEYAEQYGMQGFDYFCKHPSVELQMNENGNKVLPMIQGGRYTDYLIPPPDWCPIKLNVLNQNKNPQTDNKNMKTPKTYSQKWDAWVKASPTLEWKDIEINKVYHFPPVYNEKRSDVYVVRKNEFHIYCYAVKNGEIDFDTVRYFYKSGKEYKYLTIPKVKKYDLAKLEKQVKTKYNYFNQY